MKLREKRPIQNAGFFSSLLKRSRLDKGGSIAVERFKKVFCNPLLRSSFEKRMRHTRGWNPIAWLQDYRLAARSGKWTVCLLFVAAEGAFLLSNPDDRSTIENFQTFLLITLGIMITIAAVSSFSAEKHSGALELLLVTPLGVNKIIAGRVLGLWQQFLPAIAIVFGFSSLMFSDIPADNLFYSRPRYTPLERFLFAESLFTLPFLGLYFSLRLKNAIVASFCTGITLCIIWASGYCFGFWFVTVMHSAFTEFEFGLLGVLVSHPIFAILACFLLNHSLSRRIYPFA